MAALLDSIDFEEWKWQFLPARELKRFIHHIDVDGARCCASSTSRVLDGRIPLPPPPKKVYAEFFVLLPGTFIEPFILARDHLNANIRFNLSSVSISFLGCPRCDAIYL